MVHFVYFRKYPFSFVFVFVFGRMEIRNCQLFGFCHESRFEHIYANNSNSNAYQLLEECKTLYCLSFSNIFHIVPMVERKEKKMCAISTQSSSDIFFINCDMRFFLCCFFFFVSAALNRFSSVLKRVICSLSRSIYVCCFA